MLLSLSIQNYALIRNLKIDFSGGLSTITGETGAGKSILLGAFSLLLGSRADASVLLDQSGKCIVEASFNIKSYKLQSFFRTNDLEYNDITIIRREIHDNGRSRAFINDSPVNLSVLKELGDYLIDVHSQHENLYLNTSQFRFDIIDSLAGNQSLMQSYATSFRLYRQMNEELANLTDKAQRSKNDLDYLTFQFEELDKAQLREGEMAGLEEEAQTLSHAEEIRNNLQLFSQLMSEDELSVLKRIKEASSLINKLKGFYPNATQLTQRLESSYFDLKDISNEAESLAGKVDLDPGRLELVNSRINLLFSLCQKHRVKTDAELIAIREKLQASLLEITSFDDQVDALQKKIDDEKKKLKEMGQKLSAARKKAIVPFEKEIASLLKSLGMPNAVFTATLVSTDEFGSCGMDELQFLFSANKQVAPSDIAKVASGGELSRLMLSIKSVVSSSLALPSIIFDEIDTGVSGEIADKMGTIMRTMAKDMQVISITHLPQVASKGASQYLVYKTDTKEATNTHIKLLSKEERVTEIAKMLSGEKLTDVAIENAKILLKQ